MVLASAMFSALRVLEVLVTIPTLGMLAWFVHPYVKAHQTVPSHLLLLFIVSTIAAAWALLTLYQFRKLRSFSGPFIALIDLALCGALLAGIILLRSIARTNCSNITVPIGFSFGDHSYSGGSSWGAHFNKQCTMMKVSWALAVAAAGLFLITALLSLLMHRSSKTTTHHTKEYNDGRRSESTSTYTSRRHRHTSHV